MPGVRRTGTMRVDRYGISGMSLFAVPGALAGVTGEVRYPPPFGLEGTRPRS